jgi:hypothetical protein
VESLNMNHHGVETPGFLSKYFREEVLAEAQVQYDQA